MTKQTIIIGAIVVFLTMIAHIGIVQCQEYPGKLEEQIQSKHMEKMSEDLNDDNPAADKNLVVEMIGLVIKNNLFYEYQRIDTRELEDRVERSR
jgi:hypothetical protein